MAYSVNSYNNHSSQPSMGLGQGTSLQNLDKEKIRQEAKNNNNIVTNTLNDHDEKEKLYVAGATFASWLGISKAMDVFNAKCRTQENTSLLHKVQSGADKVGHAIEDNKVGKKVFSAMDKSSAWVKKNIVNKNKILSSIANTPAKPQLSSPKMMLNGTLAETAQDAVEAIQKYCRNKNVEIKSLGLSAEQFEKISSEPGKYIGNLIKICKRIPDEAIEVGSQAPVLKTILRRRVYPSELVNKLTVLGKKSIIGETKNLSRLGKIVPKEVLRIVEGLTNGTAGGKIAIAMQAMCFGDAIVRTVKAPKGEKGKTFAESIINDLSFYLMMPLGLSAIYGACGTKYIGMSKSQVQSYRVKLNELNKKVASNSITKEAYKAEKKVLKDLLKGDTKILKTDKFTVKLKKGFTNILNKPVKTAGKIASAGLERIKPYAGKDANIFTKANILLRKGLSGSINLFSKIPILGSIFGLVKGKTTTFKGFAGGTLRFCTYMFLISPFLAKTMTKIGHKIFGKPTNSILDEGKKDEIKTDKAVVNTAKQVMNEQKVANTVQQPRVEEPFVRQNLLDKYRVSNVQTQTPITTKVNTPKVKEKRYIPSTEAVKPDYETAIKKYNNAMISSLSYEKMAKKQAAARA